MLVTNIRVESKGNICELRAEILSKALPEPVTLWYRFPVEYREYINPDNGNPFLAAVLLLAMRTGEELQISKPVSYRLLRNADGPIQDFYKYADPSLNRIHVRSSGDLRLDYGSNILRKGVGLFFSGGVDSFYSLLKNITDHPSDLYSLTHLIVVNGFDIPLTNDGIALFQKLLEKCDALERKYGKKILPVTTNVRELSEKFVRWEKLYHSAAMASVTLALESVLECVYHASAGAYGELVSLASHPILVPLYQTEGCGIIHDGNETTRLEKVRFISQFPIVMDMLRVCTGNQYNCGWCEKCIRTMIELHAAGALDKCGTLPHKIHTERIYSLAIDPYQTHFFNELIETLGTTEDDLSIKEALRRITRYDVSTNQLQEILNSKSWRFTQPLRSVFSWLLKIKSLFAEVLSNLIIFLNKLANNLMVFLNIRNTDHYSRVYAACQLPVTAWLLRKVFHNRVLIWYWNEERYYVNFGDYITKELLDKFGYKSVEYRYADLLNILDKYDFCLLGVGSHLNKYSIDEFNIHKIFIWGQGKGFGEYFDIRSEPYKNKVKIFAVRGPQTIRQLKLNADTPLGDPGFLMPLFFEVRKDHSQYKVTYIPHWSNRSNWNVKRDEIGAERLVDIMCNKRRFWLKLNEIVSSKFVLTNSLHAAIVSHAYQIPWALCLAEGDELNFPEKWDDFFEFLGIDKTGNAVKNYEEGLKWWDEVGSKAEIRDLLPLIDSFPLPIKNKKVSALVKKLKADQFVRNQVSGA